MVAADPPEQAVTADDDLRRQDAAAHPPEHAVNARDDILRRVRAALADQPAPVPVPRDYQRVGDHPAGSAQLLRLLADRLLDYKATVHSCTSADLPATIATALALILPSGGRVVVPDGFEPSLPLDAGIDVVTDDPVLSHADLDGVDAVITTCVATAALTGTIVLDGGAGQGRRALSLVPDRHVCVVRAEQVVQTIPELLARLDPTRPLTFISGPSATSDIELQRVEGVHGPRTLVVVIVSDG